MMHLGPIFEKNYRLKGLLNLMILYVYWGDSNAAFILLKCAHSFHDVVGIWNFLYILYQPQLSGAQLHYNAV